MKSSDQVATIRFRRTHLWVLALAGVFLVGAASVLGALDRLMIVLAPGLVLIAAPAHFFRLWLARRRLLPLNELVGTLEQDEKISPAEAELGLQSISQFSSREAFTGVLIWPLGALVLILGTDALLDMTLWQALIVGALGLMAGWIDGLLAYHAGVRFLTPFRIRLETYLDPDALARRPSQRMAFQLIFSVMVVFIMGLGMASLVWFGLMRDSKAEQILLSHRAEFQKVVRGIPRGLVDGGGLASALRDAGESVTMTQGLVVIDSNGQVVAGAQPLTQYQNWLQRIAVSGAQDWHDLQAPFLFMARRLAPDRILVWVAEMEVVHQAMGSKRWRALLGVLLTALTCLLLGASVIRTGLRPLGSLAERLRAYQGDDLPSPPKGLGELPVLSQAIEDFAESVRNTLKTGRRAVDGLMNEHRQMKNKVIGVSNAATLRSEMAEQTATAVFEMRSSIQSVTDQVRSLREASTDCSS